MEQRQVKPGGRMELPQLAASKRFGRYKTEEQKDSRQAIVHSSTVTELVVRFSAFLGYDLLTAIRDANRNGTNEDAQMYKKALEQIEGLGISPSDVERFSALLPQTLLPHEEEGVRVNQYIGLFLSALVNEGDGTSFTIHTRGLEDGTFNLGKGIYNLGYGNSKDLRVLGNVGNRLGNGMRTGRIHVTGFAGESVGIGMSGGKIIIDGDVTGISSPRTGGEIHLYGGIGSIGDVKGGRIYHKGKLIVDR